MLIEASEKMYKLYFRRNTRVKKHVVESGPGYSAVLNKREVTTTAILEEVDAVGGTIHEGKAVCGILDVFNKETGRVLAMKKAMQGIPRNTREVIWQKYHGRKTSDLDAKSILLLLTRVEALTGLSQGTLTSHLIPTNETLD